jgi:predicted nuclease with TOPRIM domain
VITLQLWQLVIGGVITLGGAYITARLAGRASVKVAEVNVAQSAFTVAEGIYRSAIARLETELEKERAEREEERKHLQGQITELKDELRELRQGASSEG